MKILFILDLYKPHIGWVEILFENIINNLVNSWHKVVVLTSKYSKELPEYESISNSLEIYRIGNNRYDFMFHSIGLGIKLAKESDIIHTTTYNSAIPSWIIWKLSWKKVVLTVHEIFWKLWYRFMGFKWFFFKAFESLIFKFNFDKYICVSNYTKNNLRVYFWVSDYKLVTVYNWIDYSFWNKDNFSSEFYINLRKELWLENNFVWLFYWRPWISKGLEFYLKSIPEIIKNISEFKALLIVPDSKNNPLSLVKDQIKELNIEKNVVLIPGISNKELPKYILASDFVIIPSMVEWFWFAVAEVSALWQNLITTQASAIPEVASGKVNFIEPANVSDIIKAVLNFRNNIYTEIPKKEFKWEDNTQKTLEIYNEILWK